MKKLFAALMVALVVVVGSHLLLASTVQAIQAPASISTLERTSVSSVKVATPGKAVTTPFVNGAGVKPVWLYVSCYWAIDGAKYCWRYACTYFERTALGCRDGWYRVTIWYA